MDWAAAIGKNREALRRILASLVAMAGLGPHPEARAEGEPRSTLPRDLHRAVLRLLRPAEAAARRLIVIAARGLVVALPALKTKTVPPAPPAKPSLAILRSLGIAIVLPPGARIESPRDRTPRKSLLFALADPPGRPFRPRRPMQAGVPRIWTPGGRERLAVPSSDDPISAIRLHLRLAALAAALDDLPGHAERLARWRARRDRCLASGRFHRMSPLRPGPAYGRRRPHSRRGIHQVDEILRDTHYFAFCALESPDTS